MTDDIFMYEPAHTILSHLVSITPSSLSLEYLPVSARNHLSLTLYLSNSFLILYVYAGISPPQRLLT